MTTPQIQRVIAGARDLSVHVASLALRISPLRRDGVPDYRNPVTGLDVRTGQGVAALWHDELGGYGFVDLAPGLHVVYVRDHARRYLDRRLEITVPDRQTTRSALGRGAFLEVPGLDSMANPPTRDLVDFSLRPRVSGIQMLRGRTTLQGYIERRDGLPAPFARVSAKFDQSENSYTTWSDIQGSFVLPIEASVFLALDEDDDDSAASTESKCVVRIRGLRKRKLNPSEPLLDFPAQFDSLNATQLDAFFDEEVFEHEINVAIGKNRRYRIPKTTLSI